MPVATEVFPLKEKDKKMRREKIFTKKRLPGYHHPRYCLPKPTSMLHPSITIFRSKEKAFLNFIMDENPLAGSLIKIEPRF